MISDQELQRVNDKASEKISEQFSKSKKGEDLHKLGVALGLLQLSRTDSLGKHSNKTLEEYDNEARGILGMRIPTVQRIADELMRRPEVKRKFAEARETALRESLGSNYKGRIQSFADYIVSDTFYNSINNLSDEQRAERLKKELGKLAALDPLLAQQTSTQVLAKELSRNPRRFLRQMTQQEVTTAVEKVLRLFADMETNDKTDAQEVVGETKNGLKGVSTSQKVSRLLRDSRTRGRIAQALGQALTHRSYYGAIGDEQEATQLIASLRAKGDHDTAAVVEKIRSGSAGARGLTAFSSLVAVAAIVVNWPPKDLKSAVGATSGTLSVVGTIPDLGKFLGSDIPKLIGKVISSEFRVTQRIASTGTRLTELTNAAKFAKVCKWLGPIGDAISLPFAVMTAVDEARNEDQVGMWANVVGAGASVLGIIGGIMVICSATGVGLPLAAVAAVVGIGALAVDWMFGESAMTGQVRQDLRYLGITDIEERTMREMATERVTYGQGNRKRTYTRPASTQTVRTRASQADIYKKVHLINGYMDGNTSGSEETLIYNILKDTPYDGNEFLQLIEALDGAKLADELETDWQARDVLIWMGKAYEKANKKPGKPLHDFMTELAKQHREPPIVQWIDDDKHKNIYHQVDFQVIKTCTEHLMNGWTDGSEESAIYKLLQKTNYPQFNQIMEWGGTGYAKEVRSEVATWQWQNIRKWMLDNAPGKASHRVYHIATQVR